MHMTVRNISPGDEELASMSVTTKSLGSGETRSNSERGTLSWSDYASKALLAAGLYFLAGRLGLSIPFTSGNISPVWPASGIAMAAILLWGYRIWPGIALGALLVNFFSPIPALASFGLAAGNTMSALLGAYLVRQTKVDLSFSRLRDVLGVVAAAALSPIVAASVGTTVLFLSHTQAWSGFGQAWRVWWLGDAMGVVIVIPLLFTCSSFPLWPKRSRSLELLALSVGLLGTCFSIFWRTGLAKRDDVLAFVVFPFIIWAAIRFRAAGAALATTLIAAIAIWSTAEGTGPFVKNNALHNVILLQAFIAVVSASGLMLAAFVTERQRTEDKLLEQTRLLDLANDAIFVRSLEDRVSYWNQGAERLFGWKQEEILGMRVYDVLRTEFPKPLSEIRAQIIREGTWVGELTHTKRNGSRVTVASRWSIWRDRSGRPLGFLELNTDVTDRRQAEEHLLALSGRLLKVQDDERRRIARELHDSLGQYLAAAKIELQILSQSQESVPSDKLRDPMQFVERAIAETRTISYLLHPPLLDETGFASAARWYVDGFSKRCGIVANLDIPPQMPRFRREIETALFRILQESLTNVHRHSGTRTVDIGLALEDATLIMVVKDHGKGIPPQVLNRFRSTGNGVGVGIAGMRERIKEMGGTLEIESDQNGTTVSVTVPITQDRVVPKNDEEDLRHMASAS